MQDKASIVNVGGPDSPKSKPELSLLTFHTSTKSSSFVSRLLPERSTALPHLPKGRSLGTAAHRKRVVEKNDFESSSEDETKAVSSKGKAKAISRTFKPGASTSKGKTASRTPVPPTKKARVVIENEFESD